jgi:hypothetical protein
MLFCCYECKAGAAFLDNRSTKYLLIHLQPLSSQHEFQHTYAPSSYLPLR